MSAGWSADVDLIIHFYSVLFGEFRVLWFFIIYLTLVITSIWKQLITLKMMCLNDFLITTYINSVMIHAVFSKVLWYVPWTGVRICTQLHRGVINLCFTSQLFVYNWAAKMNTKSELFIDVIKASPRPTEIPLSTRYLSAEHLRRERQIRVQKRKEQKQLHWSVTWIRSECAGTQMRGAGSGTNCWRERNGVLKYRSSTELQIWLN